MLAVSLIIIMITCIFSVYIMYPGAAQPPVTNVSGVISSNTTWTLATVLTTLQATSLLEMV